MTSRQSKTSSFAAGYCRVSTLEQSREGVSLGAQAERIRLYCEGRGLTLAHVYVDGGVSGGTPLARREQGRELLEAIARREVTAVVALKLDRLFRSTLDCLETVQRWDKQRIGLHLVDFNGAQLDTRSAMGRMMLTMASAFAEMERSLVGERTSVALQHMKRQGTRLGGVPYGFRATEPGGRLEVNHDEMTVVREILALRCANGSSASYRAIARELMRAGHSTRQGRPWQAATVRKIVERREFYA